MSAVTAIALHARHTEGYEQRLAYTLLALQKAAGRHHGRIVQATSLGAEDMVLTDLIARYHLAIAIGTLDTGMLHAQTQQLMARIEQHYGIALEVVHPRTDVAEAFVERHGQRAMFESIELRKACCAIRKLEPLSRLLADRSAWVTGLRREQSSQRGHVPLSETDDHGREKLNPLADWSWHDVWHYIAEHDVPYNALHDSFYPSIGCAPCTRAIALGEDFRAGRWWWEDEAAKECGLHVKRDPHHPAPSSIGGEHP